MTAVLAFSALPAASKLQRARCARTGRFVAWARAAALRLPGAPAVVALLPAQAVVVVVASPAPVAVVAQVEAAEVVAQVAPLSSPRAREGAAQVAPSPLRVVAVAAQALVAEAVALVADAAAALAGAWGLVARRWRM